MFMSYKTLSFFTENVTPFLVCVRARMDGTGVAANQTYGALSSVVAESQPLNHSVEKKLEPSRPFEEYTK